MNGIKNLSPKFIATNDYVISENGEFEHIGPFETISRKDKDLDKAVQSSVKIVDKEIVGAKGDQIRTQPAVLPAAVQNSGQPQITSTGGSINYVSNNTSLKFLTPSLIQGWVCSLLIRLPWGRKNLNCN